MVLPSDAMIIYLQRPEIRDHVPSPRADTSPPAFQREKRAPGASQCAELALHLTTQHGSRSLVHDAIRDPRSSDCPVRRFLNSCCTVVSSSA